MKREIIFKKQGRTLYRTGQVGKLFVEEEEFVSAAIVAIFEGCLVVNRHYREPIQGIIYDLPGGGVEAGESPEAAARRELREETGLICGDLRPLGMVHPAASLVNRVTHLFFTDDIAMEVGMALEVGEELVSERIPMEEVWKSIENGVFTDSELVHALLLATLKGHIQPARLF